MLATDSKAKMIARQYIEEFGGHAAFIPEVCRAALVSKLVLGVVTGQDDETRVRPMDVVLLQNMARAVIEARLGEGYFGGY